MRVPGPAQASPVPGAPLAPLAALQPLMDACVHCGFCLATCPSYAEVGQEMDSPRGRIYLMKAAVQNRVALTAATVAHFDTCLGCLACKTACPSGVQYGPLIEQTRAVIEQHAPRTTADRLFRRLLFVFLPYPSRLRLLAPFMGLATFLKRRPGWLAMLPPRVRALTALAPESTPVPDIVERTPSTGPTRQRIGLVTGCVQRVFFGAVNAATVRVLSAEGCEVIAPASQGCCGALALHAGERDQARAFARQLIATFEPLAVETIAINAAGCGSTLKEYGELLHDDPAWVARAAAFAAKVRDVTEILAAAPPLAKRHPLSPALRVAYHDACHLAHGQGVRQQPRDLLAAIPGVTLVAVAEPEMCCGSAGVFNLLQPAMAGSLGRRKAGHLSESGADIIVTSNPGCLLQIQSAQTPEQRRPVVHIMEVLDASIRGEELGGRS
ncbi:MAG: (Fe-S)-binding protein [Vicinamibacterales bacterium]